MAQPVLLVQNELADLHPEDITGFDWATTQVADVPSRFCSTQSDIAARVALASHRLTRRQRDACLAAKSGQLLETLIGRRAVIAMTSGASFGLTSEILYRALARDVAGADGKFATNRAMRWRDLDAALPDAPIRALLPPPRSAEDRIVSEIILYEGCSVSANVSLSSDPAERVTVCTTLRTDAAVARPANKQTVSAWLHNEGNAAVALIGVATLLAEPELETALPLDGVTPNFATIADETYRASLPIWLLTVVAPDRAKTIPSVVGPLLAESSIGPLGKLPRRGLAPLAAADRMKLRTTLGRMLDHVSN